MSASQMLLKEGAIFTPQTQASEVKTSLSSETKSRKHPGRIIKALAKGKFLIAHQLQKKKKKKKKLAMENFTKKLDGTDVQRRLTLPENCPKDFHGNHEANLKFKDEEGLVWTFRCRVSPGRSSKPALSGDWFSFVRKKGLRTGDVIVISSDM
ncbi:hypothetical protein POTOM_018180 [Populus tomentosa]|uniref:TF-B3 domain-containing protein n=1 Tax=Populus tomentosa TaxID=118781 RepID=A0A8X7ZYQ9_POPTO|nr:hypothetical protein POTOM_018180 [Populus tomentosa]